MTAQTAAAAAPTCTHCGGPVTADRRPVFTPSADVVGQFPITRATAEVLAAQFGCSYEVVLWLSGAYQTADVDRLAREEQASRPNPVYWYPPNLTWEEHEQERLSARQQYAEFVVHGFPPHWPNGCETHEEIVAARRGAAEMLAAGDRMMRALAEGQRQADEDLIGEAR